MACKHRNVEGDTTKYFVCGITGKQTDDIKCRDCMMKIEDNTDNIMNDLFGEIFGKGFNK